VLAEGLGRLSSPDGPDAVRGLAEDGGWWALGLVRLAKAIDSTTGAGLDGPPIPELND